MSITFWYILVGILLIGMALAATSVKRLPLTTSLLYLLIGIGLGPWGLEVIRVDPMASSELLEPATEFAVIVSLFTAGLKLRTPLSDRTWWLPIRLAFISMGITVALIATAGVLLMGMPVGVAVLLGAILASTDPVLASDVQVAHPQDQDRLRFSLTGEAGLNDGTAFPFIMLGLGLMGLHDIGSLGWKWLVIDVVWAVAGGLAVGIIAGSLIGRLVIHLRRIHKEAIGLDEFLSLGLLALSYGVALSIHTYGFLAVFAAGVALRRIESTSGGDEPPPDVTTLAGAGKSDEIATDPDKAPAFMAQAVLGFNEQLERLCEVAIVVLLGAMLTRNEMTAEALWFIPLLFLVIRPIAVYLGLLGARLTSMRRGLICWFGIRGVGSVYYLAYVLQHGVEGEVGQRLVSLTLATVAVSIAVHGISVTPLMNAYGRRSSKRGASQAHKTA